MSRLSHEQCRDAVSALLDGEEPPVGDEAVMAHLAACAQCSAWLEAATRVNAGVRNLPVVSSTLGERVVDRVDVHLCACATGGTCRCGNCQCGPSCTCHSGSASQRTAR